MELRHLLPLLFFTLTSTLASAAETISINVDEANPPFMYAKNGVASGVYPELLRAVFKHLGIPVDVQAKPWKRVLQELDQGKAGTGGIYSTSERLKKYDYSEPLFYERLVIYYNDAKPIYYSGIEDFKGLTIGVLRGWSYGEDFDKARLAGLFNTEEASSDFQNFQKLQAGRIDLVIAIEDSGAPFLKTIQTVRACSNPLLVNPTFLAFSKTAQFSELLRSFDSALKEMRNTGEYLKILSNELERGVKLE